MKNTPHEDGSKHKWDFIKNITIQNGKYVNGKMVSATISHRGAYKCDVCGQQRIGRAQ